MGTSLRYSHCSAASLSTKTVRRYLLQLKTRSRSFGSEGDFSEGRGDPQSPLAILMGVYYFDRAELCG
eukprot:5778712-Amphidinium_carterae.1